LTSQRLSFLSGFVAVGTDGVLETSVTYDEISACHRTITIPSNPRYRGVSDDSGFKVLVTLSGIRPLSDALVGRIPWDDPTVQIKKENWLLKDPGTTLSK
jgi:hypothetical protein